MDRGNLGKRVRALRTDRDLSQEALAREAGVSLNLVNKLERGVVTDPHYSTLSGIARALGVPVEELMREPVPLDDAPRGAGRIEEERLESASRKDPQQRKSVLASVHERQRDVEAKVEELVALAAHGEADPYQVKWALDEAQDCTVAVMLALPSSRREQDKIIVEMDPLTVDVDQLVDQFEKWHLEWPGAKRFYDDILKSLVEAGLVELKERTGQKPKPVPVGIGA